LGQDFFYDLLKTRHGRNKYYHQPDLPEHHKIGHNIIVISIFSDIFAKDIHHQFEQL
jgi:hypothetical protein